jgi:hypothetical protein
LWYSLFRAAGNPPADTVLGAGTNLAFQALTRTTSGAAGIQHGADVGARAGATKKITAASVLTAAATTAPFSLMLVDLLGFYTITSVTVDTAQTLDNTVTLPRFTNGKGVQAFITPSTVMGAATPNITLGYTNSAGTAAKATPAVLPAGLTQAPVGSIIHSGTGAGKYGPFIPLAQGDDGIRSVDSLTLSATYVSGVLNLVLCKPILTISATTLGVKVREEYADGARPEIADGACLSVLMLAGVNTPANSTVFGELELAWE